MRHQTTTRDPAFASTHLIPLAVLPCYTAEIAALANVTEVQYESTVDVGTDAFDRFFEWYDAHETHRQIRAELAAEVTKRIAEGADIKRGDFLQLVGPCLNTDTTADNNGLFLWNGTEVVAPCCDHSAFMWQPAEFKCPTEFPATYFFDPEGFHNESEYIKDTRLDVEAFIDQLRANVEWFDIVSETSTMHPQGVIRTHFDYQGETYWLYDTELVSSAIVEQQKDRFIRTLERAADWGDEYTDDCSYLVGLDSLFLKKYAPDAFSDKNVFYNIYPPSLYCE